MKIEFKIKNNKRNLFTSILFLIFGALMFAYPNSFISLVSKIIGIILVVYGILLIIKNYYETKQNSDTPSSTLILAIVLLVIGILFITLSNSIAQIVQYIIGAWILFNALERLIMALSLGYKNNKFITQLVISILLLLAGLYTILKANLPLQIIGIVLMCYAILDIIGYITTYDNIEKEDIKEETYKKIETKENIKDATIVEENKKSKKKKK